MKRQWKQQLILCLLSKLIISTPKLCFSTFRSKLFIQKRVFSTLLIPCRWKFMNTLKSDRLDHSISCHKTMEPILCWRGSDSQSTMKQKLTRERHMVFSTCLETLVVSSTYWCSLGAFSLEMSLNSTSLSKQFKSCSRPKPMMTFSSLSRKR